MNADLKRRWHWVPLVAVLVALPLTACTNDAATTPDATETPTAAQVTVETESAEDETVEDLPAVSLATTCTFLFGSNADGPIFAATDIITRFVEDPDLSTVTKDEIDSTVAKLEQASKHADASVKPYIDATATPLKTMLDALEGRADSVSFDNYKVASVELVNQCKQHILPD